IRYLPARSSARFTRRLTPGSRSTNKIFLGNLIIRADLPAIIEHRVCQASPGQRRLSSIRKLDLDPGLNDAPGIRLEQSGNGIDQQGKNQSVESERKNAVQQRESSHSARRNLDIRHLTGHSHHKGKVRKVEIVGRSSARKQEPAGV